MISTLYKIPNVKSYYLIKDQVVIIHENEIKVIGEVNFSFINVEKNSHIFNYRDYIIIQKGYFEPAVILNSEGKKLKDLNEGFNCGSSFIYSEKLFIPNKLTKSIWQINVDGENVDLHRVIKFNQQVGNDLYHLHYKNATLTKKGIDNSIIWHAEFADRGKYINLHGEQLPNEIEYTILSCSGNVLVPLKGGQLLALDGETGVEEWIWSDGDRGGKYGSDEEYVYNTDGLHLRKIEGTKGELLCKKTLRDDSINQDFYSGGPVWVRGDYIILADPTLGRIAIYNKEDLSLFKYFEIDCRIPNSESPIQLKDNLLFILGMDHILRIYDLNEWI